MSGRIHGPRGETRPNESWPTTPVEQRSEVDSGAGVADRDSVGRDQSEVCGERRADGPLDAQSRLGPQGAGREGAEKPRAGFTETS